MAMNAPFDRDAICQHWQPMDWQSAATPSNEAARFLRYYQIHFAEQLDGVSSHFGYMDTADFRLACYLWQPSGHNRGTLLVNHGYLAHTGLMAHTIKHLLQLGFTVAAFDWPGHGLSSGEPAHIASFDQYQQALDVILPALAQLPAPHHWLCHSMAGAIAMQRLQHRPVPFERIILLAPLVWPTGWALGKYLHALLRHVVRHVPRHFVNNSHNDDFLAFLAEKDPLQCRQLSLTWISAWKKWLPPFRQAAPCQRSLCIIQGTDDTTVDWQKNLPEIQRLFPAATLHTLEDGRHQLPNESQPWLGQLHALIGQNLIG